MNFKDCAEKAGVKESTARFYRDRFEEFFTFTGEGRQRKYTAETIDVLKYIADLYAQNLNADQVKEKLQDRFGVPVQQEENSNSTAITQYQKEFAEYVSLQLREVFVQELQKRDMVIIELRERLNEVSNEIAALRKNVDERDKQILELMRSKQEQQQLSNASKSLIQRFLDKIFSKGDTHEKEKLQQ